MEETHHKDKFNFFCISLVSSIALGYVFAFIFNYRSLELYERTGLYITIFHVPALFYAIVLLGLSYTFKNKIMTLINQLDF